MPELLIALSPTSHELRQFLKFLNVVSVISYMKTERQYGQHILLHHERHITAICVSSNALLGSELVTHLHHCSTFTTWETANSLLIGKLNTDKIS